MEKNEWKSYVFSDFVSINPTVRLESSKEYSFVEMKDLNENYKYVYPSVLKKLTGGARFQEKDTLFARITPCLENGKICQVKKLNNGVGFGSTEFLVFRGKDGISDTDFVYYLSHHNEVRRFAEINMLGTSGRQRVTRDAFDNLELLLPSLTTQRRIADILSALDDKIELNRQTNIILEAIAQAIFKEWFVNFNFPGATGEMGESELGMIPKGWRVGNFLEIADLLSGGTPKTQVSAYWDGQIKWVSAKDVSNAQGTFVLDTERQITQTGVDKSNTKILPALTTIVTARGTVGCYCLLAVPMAMNQTNYGLKSKMSEADYYVFFSLANLVSHLRQAAYGTIFDTVTTKTFESSKVFIPPITIIRDFDRQVAPVMGQVLNNLQETATIATIRDALLPKLMSGEIKV